MSWLADLIQIAAGSDGFWMTIALILFSILVRKWYGKIKSIDNNFEKIVKALTKDDEPIDLNNIFDDKTRDIGTKIGDLLSMHVSCQKTQQVCSGAIKEISEIVKQMNDEPWRGCRMFADCPAIRDEREYIKQFLENRRKYTEEIQRTLTEIKDIFQNVNDMIHGFIENYSNRLLDLIEKIAREKLNGNNREYK